MSKVQKLKDFVNQRLSAAAEEIFELFERTILEYEEKLCGSKENQHKQMIGVYYPEVRSHRADVQQVLVIQEEVSLEQQDRSSYLDQVDPPEPLHIKEEQEEQWSSQEGEQLQRAEEGDVSSFMFTHIIVKSEYDDYNDDDVEEPQSSQLHENQTEGNRDTQHLKTEADGEDCEGSEPNRNFNPVHHLQPVTDEEITHSESETDDSCDWEETSELGSGLNLLQSKKGLISDEACMTEKKSSSSPECALISGKKKLGLKHIRAQGEEKPFICTICGERFGKKKYLSSHMMRHTKAKCFSCSFCEKGFPKKVELARHMRVHTGEKPFSCSVCGKSFTQKSSMYQHIQVHTGEKPFSCSVCGSSFRSKSNLYRHQQVHTGAKPFRCSECGRNFTQKTGLYRHQQVHSGEKPFSCSECGKSYTQKSSLYQHQQVHTGEKPHSCSVCGSGFLRRSYLVEHMRLHTGEKPFVCSVCGKSFSQKSGLYQHQQGHTREEHLLLQDSGSPPYQTLQEGENVS
ncbi:zinc finger protein 180-like [Xyrichtys novacula]|uniref:Zinc finger protein 180-like n=1 Tax=Xyrichtys novacula TaxID=13765 RepID=A0AAV1HDV1_XYRNO|nr:zinc finger protein 180-like [Xyrichtys novacula]